MKMKTKSLGMCASGGEMGVDLLYEEMVIGLPRAVWAAAEGRGGGAAAI